jgi:hypothetical protein
MTTERSRRLQPERRVRRDARQPGPAATLAQPDGRAVRGYGRTARTPRPPGRVVAAPTRSTRSPVQPQRTRTWNARTPTWDTGGPLPDIGQRTRGHRLRGQWTITPDTGHPTPGTGHRTRGRDRYADRRLGTAGIRADILDPRPPDCPLGRRTVDLWTAPSNDAGSATVRYLPARDYLPHHQAPARSVDQAASLAHCSRVLDLDSTSGGQRDEGKVWCAGQVGGVMLMGGCSRVVVG